MECISNLTLEDIKILTADSLQKAWSVEKVQVWLDVMIACKNPSVPVHKAALTCYSLTGGLSHASPDIPRIFSTNYNQVLSCKFHPAFIIVWLMERAAALS